ncbi:MAG: PIF1 family DEAD/DEAH box helicase [Patescibacteria group bacterium]
MNVLTYGARRDVMGFCKRPRQRAGLFLKTAIPPMTQEQALDILKTGANVFLTGEPGSGKTHVTRAFVSYLKRAHVEGAVTASTGIAATHLGGRTIHSWSGIGIKQWLSAQDLDALTSNEPVSKRINAARVLVIDEVSMLSSMTLTMIHAVCKTMRRSEEPFGGLQVVFVGDFFQLPPVTPRQRSHAQSSWMEDKTSPFAFHSDAWQSARPVVCYLSEQHRQSDPSFSALLSAIRQNNVLDEHVRCLQERRVQNNATLPQNTLKLYSHNLDVDRINTKELLRVPGDTRTFTMQSFGKKALVMSMKRGCLSPETLDLKVGAKVMFTRNDQKGAFVNGTLGTIVGFDKDTGEPCVKTQQGKRITVEPVEWSIEEGGRMLARIVQIPLRLAWAMTVHKSQGMSLDAAIVDLQHAFVEGQGYVALSRVRTLEGLSLLGWNDTALCVHPDVLAADQAFRNASLEAEQAFGDLKPDALKKMHENFVKACGGTLKATEKESQ